MKEKGCMYNKGDSKAIFHPTDAQLARLPRQIEHARGYYRYEIHWYRGQDLVRAAMQRFGSVAAMQAFHRKLRGPKLTSRRTKKKKKADRTWKPLRRRY